MRSQSGFTLVEAAVVLLILGLVLGGVLKGQEMINSAKVKALATDFRSIPIHLHAFEDRFRMLPGDDSAVATRVPGATPATTPPGAQSNRLIDGHWNSTTPTDESFLFWQHVRLANLLAGPSGVSDPTYRPTNAAGGHVGISSHSPATGQISGMTGMYQLCSKGVLGKFALQLDVQMDDGQTCTGSMRAIPDVGAGTSAGVTAAKSPGAPASCTGPDLDPDRTYTVCMTF